MINEFAPLPPLVIVMMLEAAIGGRGDNIPIQWNSPAGKNVRQFLMREELIDADGVATAKGIAWARHICSTPFPEHGWLPAKRPMNEAL